MPRSISRRAFCRSLALAGAAAFPMKALLALAGGVDKAIVFAGGTGAGNQQKFCVGCISPEGHISLIELGYRAHQILPLGEQRYLVIARRPESWMSRVDFAAGEIVDAHAVEPGCHLYGHAAVDTVNQVLITAENDTVEQTGLLVLRDLKTLDILERYPSHGLGPHEIVLDQVNQRMWVANGGFLLEPHTGRAIRNRGDFHSTLVAMDYASGRKLESVTHPDKQQSMRHIALLDADSVAIGLQHHGVAEPGCYAAYASWALGQPITTFNNPHPRRNYVTTVTALGSDRFAVSMEKDHEAVIVDKVNGELRRITLEQPQGVTYAHNDLWLTTRNGRLHHWSEGVHNPMPVSGRQMPETFWFDNHFLMV